MSAWRSLSVGKRTSRGNARIDANGPGGYGHWFQSIVASMHMMARSNVSAPALGVRIL
jgi:hypothetical protein